MIMFILYVIVGFVAINMIVAVGSYFIDVADRKWLEAKQKGNK